MMTLFMNYFIQVKANLVVIKDILNCKYLFNKNTELVKTILVYHISNDA